MNPEISFHFNERARFQWKNVTTDRDSGNQVLEGTISIGKKMYAVKVAYQEDAAEAFFGPEGELSKKIEQIVERFTNDDIATLAGHRISTPLEREGPATITHLKSGRTYNSIAEIQNTKLKNTAAKVVRAFRQTLPLETTESTPSPSPIENVPFPLSIDFERVREQKAPDSLEERFKNVYQSLDSIANIHGKKIHFNRNTATFEKGEGERVRKREIRELSSRVQDKLEILKEAVYERYQIEHREKIKGLEDEQLETQGKNIANALVKNIENLDAKTQAFKNNLHHFEIPSSTTARHGVVGELLKMEKQIEKFHQRLESREKAPSSILSEIDTFSVEIFDFSNTPFMEGVAIAEGIKQIDRNMKSCIEAVKEGVKNNPSKEEKILFKDCIQKLEEKINDAENGFFALQEDLKKEWVPFQKVCDTIRSIRFIRENEIRPLHSYHPDIFNPEKFSYTVQTPITRDDLNTLPSYRIAEYAKDILMEVNYTRLESPSPFLDEADRKFQFTLNQAFNRAESLHRKHQNTFDKLTIHKKTGVITCSPEQLTEGLKILKTTFPGLTQIAFTKKHRIEVAKLLQTIMTGKCSENLQDEFCFTCQEFIDMNEIIPEEKGESSFLLYNFNNICSPWGETTPKAILAHLNESIRVYVGDYIARPASHYFQFGERTHSISGQQEHQDHPFTAPIRDEYTQFLIDNPIDAATIIEKNAKQDLFMLLNENAEVCGLPSSDSNLFPEDMFLKILEPHIQQLLPAEDVDRYLAIIQESLKDPTLSAEDVIEALKTGGFRLEEASTREIKLKEIFKLIIDSRIDPEKITAIAEATKKPEGLIEPLVRMKVFEIISFAQQSGFAPLTEQVLAKSHGESIGLVATQEDKLFFSISKDYQTMSMGTNFMISMPDSNTLPIYDYEFSHANPIEIAKIPSGINFGITSDPNSKASMLPTKEFLFSWQAPQHYITSVTPVNPLTDLKRITEPLLQGFVKNGKYFTPNTKKEIRFMEDILNAAAPILKKLPNFFHEGSVAAEEICIDLFGITARIPIEKRNNQLISIIEKTTGQLRAAKQLNYRINAINKISRAKELPTPKKLKKDLFDELQEDLKLWLSVEPSPLTNLKRKLPFLEEAVEALDARILADENLDYEDWTELSENIDKLRSAINNAKMLTENPLIAEFEREAAPFLETFFRRARYPREIPEEELQLVEDTMSKTSSIVGELLSKDLPLEARKKTLEILETVVSEMAPIRQQYPDLTQIEKWVESLEPIFNKLKLPPDELT